MLRRPSVSPVIVREEGCSSPAFAWYQIWISRVWNNLTNRGSLEIQIWYQAAGP